ncbi:MAG: ribonuclease J [Halieaceae bacterium]
MGQAAYHRPVSQILTATNPAEALSPGAKDLWFVPLGGCGEIGINLNVYGHDGQWLIVDCGIGFDRTPGSEAVIAPDPDFISSRRGALVGMVITHAHEDHVGAVPFLWPELQCPVYCTPFTAAVLRRKLAEVGLLDVVPLHVIEPAASHSLGPFDLRWIGVTHSTPEAQCLLLETPVGRVLHTGDWKWDADPQVGPPYEESSFRQLAELDIDALVCDSTCATVEGRSPSEGELLPGIRDVIRRAKGRVVATCFGSNIARLQTLARAAVDDGRYVSLFGRSLLNNYRAALQAGYWDPALTFIDPAHVGYLPPDEVMVIATGSQGDARAALTRLAMGAHPQMELAAGDTVLFSSREIPGNELAIERVRNALLAREVCVVEQEVGGPLIHTSGHPARDELRDMYQWVKPKAAVPVHGEPHHLSAHAELAAGTGVTSQLLGRNGDLFLLAPVIGLRRGVVSVGRRTIRDS